MGSSPKQMEHAIVKNLPEKTGKSLEEWFKVLDGEKQSNKKEMKACLKEKYKVGHFKAQIIVNYFLEKSELPL
ncbi:MAG: DUF4287 domain-containing protein [Crocinitomicaceae bacterium]|nr:DUF4287 domain-containing protein [Crocinitomicaceae bacterium]